MCKYYRIRINKILYLIYKNNVFQVNCLQTVPWNRQQSTHIALCDKHSAMSGKNVHRSFVLYCCWWETRRTRFESKSKPINKKTSLRFIHFVLACPVRPSLCVCVGGIRDTSRAQRKSRFAWITQTDECEVRARHGCASIWGVYGPGNIKSGCRSQGGLKMDGNECGDMIVIECTCLFDWTFYCVIHSRIFQYLRAS